MASPNITNIPAPRVELIDPRTGLMAREWYRFFLNLFNLTGGGSNVASIADLQVGPPANETGLVAFQAQDAALGLPPTTPYIPPDDLDPPLQETVPRGATGALQYNNGGVFYGTLYMSYNGAQILTVGTASTTTLPTIFQIQGAVGTSATNKTGASIKLVAGDGYAPSITGNGGSVQIKSGDGGSGLPGNIIVTSGNGSSGGSILFAGGDGASGNGGAVNFFSGNSSALDGGNFNMSGGTGATNGGGFYLSGGEATNAGASGGLFRIVGGISTLGFGGNVVIQPGVGGAISDDGTTTIITAQYAQGIHVDQYANVTLSTPQTAASLISAALAGAGARSFVTDALAPVFGNTVVGGGAVNVPVYSDGTNWKVG